jgi:hypothetical protein
MEVVVRLSSGQHIDPGKQLKRGGSFIRLPLLHQILGFETFLRDGPVASACQGTERDLAQSQVSARLELHLARAKLAQTMNKAPHLFLEIVPYRHSLWRRTDYVIVRRHYRIQRNFATELRSRRDSRIART